MNVNTAPEPAHYLAWFAPGEKAFFDYRLSLFGDAAEDFMTLRRA